LNIFHLQLKALQAAGQKCLIVVDNAQLLSDTALELLLNLHVAHAQVLLVSDSTYAGRVLEHDAVRHMEGRIHHLALGAMTAEEVFEYLEICHPQLDSLPEKKKKELVRLAEGLPGRIETLLAGGKVSVNSSSKKLKGFPFPPMHMAGIAVLLIAIVAVSLWQFLPESPQIQALDEESERISVPLVVNVQQAEGGADQVIPVSEGASDTDEAQAVVDSQQVRDELARRLEQQEAKKESIVSQPASLSSSSDKSSEEVVAVSEAAAGMVSDKAPSLAQELSAVVEQGRQPVVQEKPEIVVVAKAKEVVKPTAISEPEVVATPVVGSSVVQKVTGASKDEKTLLGWPASGYTLQMLGARSEESAKNFIRSQADSTNFYHFSTVYKGLPWHVVVYGRYANRDIANAAIRKLPASLRKVKPWARSVKGVQIDIRKKKSK